MKGTLHGNSGRGVPTAATVRELRWSDFDGLRETYYELYDERDRGDPVGITLFATRPSYGDEVVWFSGFYRRVLSGDTVAAVAEVDGHPVGVCEIHRVGANAESEMAHVGELGILVRRDQRGKGIGRAMIESALRQCRGKFEVVRLSVFSNNEGAKRLYERLGFVLCGHLPRTHRRGTTYFDEDLMVLDLGHSEANR